jgi:RNA polymerase sigma-70 factor (ECF subfamily)
MPDATDSAAIEALVGRFANQIRRIGGRYGLTGSDVEDLVQEVRIRVWRAQPAGGKIEAAPASYLYRAAVSAAIDLIRRRRARRETPAGMDRPSGEAVLGAAPAADARMEQDELAETVERELETLAPDRRLVIRLHLAGYGREEITELLGWTEPRTRHLLYRGLDDLRDRLRARGLGPREAG